MSTAKSFVLPVGVLSIQLLVRVIHSKELGDATNRFSFTFRHFYGIHLVVLGEVKYGRYS